MRGRMRATTPAMARGMDANARSSVTLSTGESVAATGAAPAASAPPLSARATAAASGYAGEGSTAMGSSSPPQRRSALAVSWPSRSSASASGDERRPVRIRQRPQRLRRLHRAERAGQPERARSRSASTRCEPTWGSSSTRPSSEGTRGEVVEPGVSKGRVSSASMKRA